MDIKELVNAFNLNNYGVGNVNTNFTVEGKKIFGLFASGTNIEEYLQGIGEEIIKQHYGTKEVAGRFYNLNYFPFVLGANPDKKYLGNGIVKVKLAGSTNNEVICNLKVHFANEFKRAVRAKVAACLQEEVGITREEAYEWIIETVKTGAIGKPYLYCIAFSNEYLEREYDLETFEFFKQAYIKEFNSRLENCGLKSSDFYEYKDDMLYVKNVSNKVIKSVTEYVKKEVAFDFRTPGTEDSKVENFKDVLGDFIFKWTGKSINAYEHDIFTDKKKIENGNDFVLIPLTKRYSGQLESLKHKDVYRINIKYKNLMSDIRGKTAKPDVASYENPVYAFSNKQIALLLPKIMESPIAYNEGNKRFEFAVDLENFKRRGSSRSSSTVTSSTHAGPSGLETQPNPRKRNRDSGIGESPPRLEDSVAHPSSDDPGSFLEQSQVQRFPMRDHGKELKRPPRRGSGKKEETGGPSRVLPGEEIGQTSAWSQQPNRWSLPAPSAGPSLLQPSRPSSWKGANPVGASPWSQPIGFWSSPTPSAEPSLWQPSRPLSRKGANESGSAWTSQPIGFWSSQSTSSGFSDSLWTQSGSLSSKRPTSVYSIDSGKGDSLERPQPNSSITTSAVPGISESGKGSNVAAVPVDNKRPQSLPLADFSTRASDKTVKAFLYFLDYFSSPEGKKQLPLLLSPKAEKQLSSISDPREQENLLDFLFSTEGNKQLCSLFSSENKQQLYSLFSIKGEELLFSPSPEGQKMIPLVLSPEGKERLPLLLSPEGEQISKPFSLEAGNIISLLIYSRVEPKNMSHRSFRDKLAKWLHRNSSLSKVASPQEKPLTDDEKKELRLFLCPKLQKKLDSNSLENPQLIYLLYTPGGKKKLDLLLLSSPEKEGKQLHPDLLSKSFGDEQEISGNASTSSRDSGIFSGSSSQGSVSSELKHPQQVKHMSEALGK